MQQSWEKAFKAVHIANGNGLRKTHDIRNLAAELDTREEWDICLDTLTILHREQISEQPGTLRRRESRAHPHNHGRGARMGQDEDRRKIVQIIREEFPDATIKLFGSRARGDHYQHSDYDIAIISENIEDKDKAYRTVSKPLHEAVQASFDLVFYTPDEYSRGKDGFLPELIERERVELSA